MNVMIAPYFKGNQYLQLLESKLQERGVDTFRNVHAHPLWPFLIEVIYNDIDVLHLHWTHPYFILGDHSRFQRIPFSGLLSSVFAVFFLLQVYACSLICSRIIWTIHNRSNHERKLERLDKWVSRRLLSITDAIQVWDAATKTELQEYLGCDSEKLVAIPHGNYCPLYAVDEYNKSEARAELSLDQDKRTVLYFGRIRKYKQVPELLKAWNEIGASDAQLVIAGNSKSSELTKRIKSLGTSQNNVHLDLRYIPDSQVPIYFAACDIAVFPYRSIFNSGSVLLAMTFGRPFLAPQMGSIPNVDSGGNLLYKSTEGGLQAALADALDASAEDLEKIGLQNRRTAKERYNWDSIADQMIKMYQGDTTDNPGP